VFIGFASAIVFLVLASSASASGGYSFVTAWGSSGTGDGQFNVAEGLTLDASGNVYVTDSTGGTEPVNPVNNRVEKFDSNGTFLTKWGSGGSGNGQFDYPVGMAVDGSGNVYVADENNGRVEKFSSSGTFLTQITLTAGPNPNHFPVALAVDGSGDLYVTDVASDTVLKYDSSGTLLTTWGAHGTGDGQFNFADGLAVDSSGNVYVTDVYNNRVEKFTSSGTFLAKWGSQGTGDGQFNGPDGVAVDSSGNVYVSDCGNSRVEKFDSSGTFLTKFSNTAPGQDAFGCVRGLAVDGAGNVYVVANNSRVEEFAPPDVTPPTVSCVVPDQTVWYGSDLSLTCTASDSQSGLANAADALFNLATSVSAGTETASASTNSRSVCDSVGNCAPAGPYMFKIDRLGPTVTCSGSTPLFTLGQAGAMVSASVSDGGSGAANASVSAAADTSSTGLKQVSLTGYDNVGNATTVSCPYQVGYASSGWLGAVDNPPTVNTGKAGRTYPIRWQLMDANGNLISSLAAVRSVTYKSTACSSFTGDPTDGLGASSTGGTSLRYDTTTNQYVYNWATPGPGCYTLFLTLTSGQVYTALFDLF
jgi:sugar lactone lactonase YvrE